MLRHNGSMKFVHMSLWLLTSIGAINWGLKPLGYNLVEKLGAMTSFAIIDPIYYIIGVAGVLSLLMFFSVCAKECK